MKMYQRLCITSLMLGSVLLPASVSALPAGLAQNALVKTLVANKSGIRKGLVAVAAGVVSYGVGYKLGQSKFGNKYIGITVKNIAHLDRKRTALWATGAVAAYGLGRLVKFPKTGKVLATLIGGYGLGSAWFRANTARKNVPTIGLDDLYLDDATLQRLRMLKSAFVLGPAQSLLLTGDGSEEDKENVALALAHELNVSCTVIDGSETTGIADAIHEAISSAETSQQDLAVLLIKNSKINQGLIGIVKKAMGKTRVLLCLTDTRKELPGKICNHTVEIGLPNIACRTKLIEQRLSELAQYEHKNSAEALKKQAAVLAQKTVGVSSSALTKFFDDLEEVRGTDVQGTRPITNKELEDSIAELVPTHKQAELVTTTIEDVVGGVPEDLEIFMDQMQHPEAYEKLIAAVGIEKEKMRGASSGLLLYGPPGTGKSLIARAIAGTLKIPFVEFKSNEVKGELQGQTEKFTVNKIKEARKKAGDHAEARGLPRSEGMCIVFMDEVDGVAKKRTPSGHAYEGPDLLQVLLSEIDGGVAKKEGRIFLIATTNRKDRIDPGMLRAGRLETHIEIGYPSAKACKDLFEHYLKKVVHHKQIITAALLDDLARRAHDAKATGADIERIVMVAFRNSAKKREVDVTAAMLTEAAHEVFKQLADRNDAQERAEAKQ